MTLNALSTVPPVVGIAVEVILVMRGGQGFLPALFAMRSEDDDDDDQDGRVDDEDHDDDNDDHDDDNEDHDDDDDNDKDCKSNVCNKKGGVFHKKPLWVQPQHGQHSIIGN